MADVRKLLSGLTAEQQDGAIKDMMVTGTAFIRTSPDGTKTRIAPDDVFLADTETGTTQDISNLVAVVERMQKARSGMDGWMRTAEIPESVAAFIEAAADCTAAMRADIERLQRELEAAAHDIARYVEIASEEAERACKAERALATARAETFREAAEIAEGEAHADCEVAEQIAAAIRARAEESKSHE